jgi:alpha-amylase/alpha-mannosidase (GH57 family)
MHQPDYREPKSDRLAMPWVRLHALKDYLDMPLTAAAYEHVKVTFNLVPSLIDQLELYLDGGTDRHLELTSLKADELNPDQKAEILETFFIGHAPHMIEPHARYRELHKKYVGSASQKKILPALFTSTEIRDLQVWSNLAWVDPMFRVQEPIKSLFDKHRRFTEEDKQALLAWQKELIGRIVPT